MTPLLDFCLATFCALPQGGDGEAPRPVLLDGVAVQAGEELVTLSELERELDMLQARGAVKSRAEAEQLRALKLRQLWELSLEVQQGRDMGVDPAVIERQNRLVLQQEQQDIGISGYLEKLEQSGQDALQAESDQEEAIHRWLWEASKTGTGAAGRRPTVDRTVRPGQLREVFRQNREKLAPTMVQFQVLIVSAKAQGGAEPARKVCEDARTRILAGEDMADLVDEFGADLRETQGMTPLAPLPSINDERLMTFAESAAVGDLADVWPLLDARTGKANEDLGFQLVRLADRQSSPEPDFEDLGLQRSLREYSLRAQRERILNRERAILRRDSYSWINPLLRGPQEQGGG